MFEAGVQRGVLGERIADHELWRAIKAEFADQIGGKVEKEPFGK